jgi:homoserine dehydrogenase
MVVGLGHVGRAVLKAWADRVPDSLRLVAACDTKGRFRDEAGLDPRRTVERKLAGDYQQSHSASETAAWIREVRPELVVELTITNFETGEPAVPDILAGLEIGAHVVTSAKSHQRSREEMQRVAEAARKSWRIFLDHAAHLAGIPVTEMMAGVGMRVTRIEGVLNGTTNYMLRRLEEGASFDTALQEAIDKGFAERNWRYDVEGVDVAIKLIGLTRRLMDRTLDLSAVTLAGLEEGRKGIDGLASEKVTALLAEHKRVKLFGMVELDGDTLTATVKPRVIPMTDPFSRIGGFNNAVAIRGELNGTEMDLFLSGPGAGADETASRVIGNIRWLAQRLDWR